MQFNKIVQLLANVWLHYSLIGNVYYTYKPGGHDKYSITDYEFLIKGLNTGAILVFG